MLPHKRTQKTPPRGVALALAMLASFVLAGCSGLGGGGNQAPVAQLRADRDSGWTTDSFTFDARDSTDPDGEIRTWLFDFGDGNATSVDEGEDANVTHTYGRGGDYHATLTVVDSGTGDGQDKKSVSTSVAVRVHERMAVAGQVLYAGPVGDQTARFAQAFAVREDASRVEAVLAANSILAVGSTEIQVRLIDPSGAVLAQRDVSLPAGMNETIALDSVLPSTGDHVLEVTAASGGCTISGQLRVFYGA